MNNIVNRITFFIGWLLSPMTFWNDIFVNIPISYFAASVLFRFIRVRFDLLVICCYWASNVVGLLMMYASGRLTLAKGGGVIRDVVITLFVIVVYSAVIALLTGLGILRPI